MKSKKKVKESKETPLQKFFNKFRKKTMVEEDFEPEKKLKKLNLKLGPYETEIDVLYKMVHNKEKVSVEEVIKKFKISKELAEEWAKILEDHQLVSMHYPPFGSPALVKYKEEEKKEEK
jgi:hydroxymethylpyrimidine pyrophosphatase-like HAD family hydrolase